MVVNFPYTDDFFAFIADVCTNSPCNVADVRLDRPAACGGGFEADAAGGVAELLRQHPRWIMVTMQRQPQHAVQLFEGNLRGRGYDKFEVV